MVKTNPLTAKNDQQGLPLANGGVATNSLIPEQIIVTFNDGSVPHHLLTTEQMDMVEELAKNETNNHSFQWFFGLGGAGIGFIQNVVLVISDAAHDKLGQSGKMTYFLATVSVILLTAAAIFWVTQKKPKLNLEVYFASIKARPTKTITK